MQQPITFLKGTQYFGDYQKRLEVKIACVAMGEGQMDVPAKSLFHFRGKLHNAVV